jgi:HD-like signal output (HDOD) protein
MITEDEATKLAAFVPLCELSYAGLAQLVGAADTIDLDTGDTLLRGDDRDSVYYLLDGRVALTGSGARSLEVSAATPRSKLPLLDTRAEYEQISPVEPSRLVRIDNALMQSLLQSQQLDDSLDTYEIAENELDDTESAIFEELFRTYRDGNLELPSMPEVALRIRAYAQDPDVSLALLARVAQTDPAVSGALIRAANSSLYAHGAEVTSVREAVGRLGLKTTQNLAVAQSISSVFQARSSLLRRRAHEVWQHSVALSSIASAIARRIGGIDPERALLAGLLARVGTVPILGFIDALDDTPSERFVDSALNKLTAPVGVLVISYWEMGSDLTTATELYDAWNREHEGPPDCCDVVHVARLVHAAEAKDSDMPSPEAVAALGRLGLQGEDSIDELRAEAQEEIRVVRNLLSG